ncbi:MAG: DNA glycosylase AlkZ-like family protein, partial [Natronosporangium sp.]
MAKQDIATWRLRSHGLAGAPFRSVTEVVRWLGAVQSQEYAVAKWSVGQRATGLSDAGLDLALAEGTVLRTHVLRPTWHFVAAADLRWLLALTAPRVHAANAHYYRKFELDQPLFRRSNALLARALAGGQQLTRPELARVLAAGGIEADALRLGYLLMYAELAAVICSGGLRGRQRSYALFDERVPAAPARDRDEALADLTTRYFTSHG